MSRALPRDGDKRAKDQMTEAMKENRAGATEKPVDEDQQTRAMSNEFELEDTPGKDKMAEAMSERRKAADKTSRTTKK